MRRYVVTDATGLVVRTGEVSDTIDAPLQAIFPGERVHLDLTAEPGDRIVNATVFRAERPDIVVTIDMVKAEQARRLRYTDWAITRAADPTDGRPVPPEIIEQRQRIREAAQRLEGLSKIPPDYRNDALWT